MSFPRFDRLVLSDGGPLLFQYISDACVSSRQNDKQFFFYLKTNQRRLRGALLSRRYIGTSGWTVWGKWRKGKKSSCSEKSSSEKSSVESQKGHVIAHGHVVALEGRACAWACARFCPWFAKIICSPVSGTCLAEQSKPCANLALPCSTTAFSWGPATKRKCKSCQRHSNVTLILFCLLYLFGKGPYKSLQCKVMFFSFRTLSSLKLRQGWRTVSVCCQVMMKHGMIINRDSDVLIGAGPSFRSNPTKLLLNKFPIITYDTEGY